MDESRFRLFLKRAGKKEHVVEGLVHQVREFEKFLTKNRDIRLDGVRKQDILEYTKTLDKGRIKVQVRGLVLYYKFIGNKPVAKFAHSIREEQTAKTRQVFKLRNFRGVDMEHIEKLEALRIVTVEQMLKAGKTPGDRQRLAKQTGIPPACILELVKLSDLSRLGAIKSVRARLYYDAGLDTPDKFTRWEVESLRKKMTDFVERTGFDGIAPLPAELQNAIETAKKLPRVVQY